METGRRQLLLFAVLCEGGMAINGLALGYWLEIPVFAAVVPDLMTLALGILSALPLTAIFLTLYHFPVGPFAEIRRLCDSLIGPLFRDSTSADLALISVLAGLGEEILFRGVMQVGLSGWLGSTSGLLLASLAFGLLHAITPGYVVLATSFGIYLGWLYQATGSLVPPIVGHALYDFLVLWYLHRATPSTPYPLPEMLKDPEDLP